MWISRWIILDNGVAFSIELLEWGRTFSDFGGIRELFIFTVSKRTRIFVLQVKSKVFFTQFIKNQRKTIVNSWVRCLENNQLVITSGFPTVNLGNDRNSDYKYTILVLETQYFSCCLLHFINSYLGIYLKTKKRKKQQNK